jgi:type III secretory pathway component EscS
MMNGDRPKIGLDDPRAVEILTAEHWSLLSSRTLGYQEMFGRATIFIAILSGTVLALALLAQATQFGRQTLSFAVLLISVALFIGVVTFVRSVAINYEDARWVTGMNRVAALNSVLAGSLASAVSALLGGGRALDVSIGVAVSLASAVLHVQYAARFRQSHAPSTRAPG